MGLLDRFRSPRVPMTPSLPPVGTRVGTDDGFCAVVDGSAVVHLPDRPVRVGWWIGADDQRADAVFDNLRHRRQVLAVMRFAVTDRAVIRGDLD